MKIRCPDPIQIPPEPSLNLFQIDPTSVKMRPRGTQEAPKRCPRGLRGAQETPKSAQEAPKRHPRAPKRCPRASQILQMEPQGVIFRRFFVLFRFYRSKSRFETIFSFVERLCASRAAFFEKGKIRKPTQIPCKNLGFFDVFQGSQFYTNL